MENPKGSVSSKAVRTDYGSTSDSLAPQSQVRSSNSDGDEKGTTDQSEIVAERYTASTECIVSYQNLYNATAASQVDLFEKSTPRPSPDSFLVFSSSRFSRMTVDKKLPSSGTISALLRLEFSMNVLNQMCIGFVTIYLSWMCLRLELNTTVLHAWLVTIGFSFLMAEAIMCHYNGNVLTYNFKRNTKTTVHWVLQVLGGGLGVAGGFLKCYQKGFLLKTIHGKVGFASLIFCLISMLTGLTALFSAPLKKFLSPLMNKTVHNLLGLAAFVLALVAQVYGYRTGFFRHRISSDMKDLMEYLTILSLILSCIGPLKALYNKSINFYMQYR